MTTTARSAPGAPGGTAAGPRRLPAALAGFLSAAVALGVAELLAGLVGPASTPVVAVGDVVITLTPEPVKAFAISTFGENDKIALIVGTLALVAVFSLVVGLVALRRLRVGQAGIASFGLLGVLAAVTGPAGGLLDGIP